jgi:hypothetical protein
MSTARHPAKLDPATTLMEALRISFPDGGEGDM